VLTAEVQNEDHCGGPDSHDQHRCQDPPHPTGRRGLAATHLAVQDVGPILGL
jgi:hypothetical protein